MTPAATLAELARLGVVLSSARGSLRYRAPRGAMTPELVEGLRRHKAEILRVLEEATTSASSYPTPESLPEPAPGSLLVGPPGNRVDLTLTENERRQVDWGWVRNLGEELAPPRIPRTGGFLIGKAGSETARASFAPWLLRPEPPVLSMVRDRS